MLSAPFFTHPFICFVATDILIAGYSCALQGAVPVAKPEVEKVAYKWRPESSLDLKAGNLRSLGQIGLMAPISQSDHSLLFMDARFMRDTKANKEGNFGIGYRLLDARQGWIWGGYGYFDHRKSENHNTFRQITIGIEGLSEEWDVRLNTYLPFTRARPIRKSKAQNTFFRGHREYISQRKELPLKGVDVEIGRAVPHMEALRLFIGGYHFWRKGTDTINGVRVRADYAVDYLTFKGEYQYDKVRRSSRFIGVSIHIPLGDAPQKSLTKLERRMMQKPVRDIDIVVRPRRHIEAVPTGRHFIFVHSASHGGDGTYERPLNEANSEELLTVLESHPSSLYHNLDTGDIKTSASLIPALRQARAARLHQANLQRQAAQEQQWQRIAEELRWEDGLITIFQATPVSQSQAIGQIPTEILQLSQQGLGSVPLEAGNSPQTELSAAQPSVEQPRAAERPNSIPAPLLEFGEEIVSIFEEAPSPLDLPITQRQRQTPRVLSEEQPHPGREGESPLFEAELLQEVQQEDGNQGNVTEARLLPAPALQTALVSGRESLQQSTISRSEGTQVYARARSHRRSHSNPLRSQPPLLEEEQRACELSLSPSSASPESFERHLSREAREANGASPLMVQIVNGAGLEERHLIVHPNTASQDASIAHFTRQSASSKTKILHINLQEVDPSALEKILTDKAHNYTIQVNRESLSALQSLQAGPSAKSMVVKDNSHSQKARAAFPLPQSPFSLRELNLGLLSPLTHPLSPASVPSKERMLTAAPLIQPSRGLVAALPPQVLNAQITKPTSEPRALRDDILPFFEYQSTVRYPLLPPTQPRTISPFNPYAPLNIPSVQGGLYAGIIASQNHASVSGINPRQPLLTLKSPSMQFAFKAGQSALAQKDNNKNQVTTEAHKRVLPEQIPYAKAPLSQPFNLISKVYTAARKLLTRSDGTSNVSSNAERKAKASEETSDSWMSQKTTSSNSKEKMPGGASS